MERRMNRPAILDSLFCFAFLLLLCLASISQKPGQFQAETSTTIAYFTIFDPLWRQNNSLSVKQLDANNTLPKELQKPHGLLSGYSGTTNSSMRRSQYQSMTGWPNR